MALSAGGVTTIKGNALTTKVLRAWALRKSGEAWKEANIAGSVIKVNIKAVKVDLGDGFTAKVKKSATPAAGGGGSDSEEHHVEAAAADADAPDSDGDEEGHVESSGKTPAAAAAAGAGGAAPPDIESVTMTNKAGSYSAEWNKVENTRVD